MTLGQQVELLTADSLASPVLFGLFRPRIVLPASTLQDMSLAELRPVFLHELAHLRRRDLWVNWTQAILQTVYWFHPLVWYANLRLRRERELIVDDVVLAHLGDQPSTYSSSLLNVSKDVSCARWLAPGYIGIVETGSSISRRICRILDCDRRLSLRLGWASGLLLLLFALVMIPQGSPAPAGDPRAGKAIADPKTDEKLTAVTGVVVDGDGRPMADARITAFPNVGPTQPFSLAIDTRTDAEGGFRVLLTRSLYFAEVTKDGLTSGTFSLYAGLAEKGPVRVTLKKGGRIAGTVVRRADGRPVGGATVWLYSRRGTKTDAQGRFELAPVERGDGGLMVLAAGLASRYVEVNLSGRDSCQVRVEMPPGFSVRGKVVDPRGQPIAGAGMGASGGSWRSTFGGSFAAITDSDGRYEIAGLPLRARDASANERHPGGSAMSDSMGDRIWVSAWHPRYKSAMGMASPPATGDSTTVDLVMRSRFAVAGVVRDHRGRPVGAAKVTCPNSVGRRHASTQTDATGSFRLDEVEDYEGWILAEAKGYALAWQRLPQPADGRVNVAFKLVRGRTAAGVVVDRAGQPIVGAVVSPTIAIDHSFDYEPGWRVTSDENGLFKIVDLPHRGRFRIDVRADGYVPVRDRRLRTWLPNTVVMQSQGVIAGQVLDERTGEPVTSLRVRLDESRGGGGIDEPEPSFPRDTREPGRDFKSTVGAFTIGGLTSGAPYAVIVSARGYAPVRVSRAIARPPDWEGWPAVIKLGVGTCVLGQVVDGQSGVAIVDAEVVALTYSGRGPGEFDIALFDSSRPGLRKTRTDRDGQFVLPELEAGTTALVAVRAPRYGLCIRRRVPFDEPVTVQLGRAGRITGSAAGLPDVDLAGAFVTLDSADASFGRARVSARDGGKYCFDGLPAGDYTVRVIAYKFEPRGGGRGRVRPEIKAAARVSLSAGETASVRFPNVPRY